jgi:SAM-dependent methyltransferase
LSSSASNALTFTGERFAPEQKGAIWHEHWHRYCVVAPLARGRRVLDAACGEGYGTFLLAAEAADIVGIDIAAEAVAHAQMRYSAPNLRYVRGSCTALPLPDDSVDLVVSFETIEHLAEQAAMLEEFRRVLSPGGVLVISSPNKPVYSGEEPFENEFHVKELTRDELQVLLSPGFPRQQWYGQRVVAHSALWAEGAAAAAARGAAFVALTDDGAALPAEPAPPMYFVVVCAAAAVALPALPGVSLFDDGAQSLFRDYIRALRREKALSWDELDARKIAEDRLAELIAAVNALSGEQQQTTELRSRVALLEAETVRIGRALAQQYDTLVQRETALNDARQRLAYRETLAGWLRWPLGRLRARMTGSP